MQQKTTLLIIVASFILLIGGVFVLSSMQTAQNNDGVVLAEKVKGNPEAAVVLQEFSDFQCPACKSFVPAVEQLLADYGDQIRFEYHHFPLIAIHRHAELSARAAEAAGVQGKFWEMHDLLFERQQNWSQNINPSGMFEAYAGELGLDTELFSRHLNASMVRDAVREDLAAARAQGFTGTPTFLLNGEKMEFDTYEEFRNQIEVTLGVAEPADASTEADVQFGF